MVLERLLSYLTGGAASTQTIQKIVPKSIESFLRASNGKEQASSERAERKGRPTEIYAIDLASAQLHFPQRYRAKLLPHQMEQELKFLHSVFDSSSLGGLTSTYFHKLLHKMCRFPQFMSATLFSRVLRNAKAMGAAKKLANAANEGQKPLYLITERPFMLWWKEHLQEYTEETRFFNAIKSDAKRNYITAGDLRPFLKKLVRTCASLDFLRDTPVFQDRYIDTVISCILFRCDRRRNGRIHFPDFRKSGLVDIFKRIEQEPDINQFREYFSYKYFYVIYRKFWELDTDHDLLLSIGDLSRYGNGALSTRVLRRIFELLPGPVELPERPAASPAAVKRFRSSSAASRRTGSAFFHRSSSASNIPQRNARSPRSPTVSPRSPSPLSLSSSPHAAVDSTAASSSSSSTTTTTTSSSTSFSPPSSPSTSRKRRSIKLVRALGGKSSPSPSSSSATTTTTCNSSGADDPPRRAASIETVTRSERRKAAPLKISQKRMNFMQFVWFILAEEDKTTEAAQRYWFNIADRDADGFISAFDMEYFYEEQLQRQRATLPPDSEIVPFQDILRQSIDAHASANGIAFSFLDVKRSQQGEYFFNILFNLSKFLADEQANPFEIAAATARASPWDRFAAEEYKLAALEEVLNNGGSSLSWTSCSDVDDDDQHHSSDEEDAEDDAYDGAHMSPITRRRRPPRCAIPLAEPEDSDDSYYDSSSSEADDTFLSDSSDEDEDDDTLGDWSDEETDAPITLDELADKEEDHEGLRTDTLRDLSHQELLWWNRKKKSKGKKVKSSASLGPRDSPVSSRIGSFRVFHDEEPDEG